jgi:hypothetical protein
MEESSRLYTKKIRGDQFAQELIKLIKLIGCLGPLG